MIPDACFFLHNRLICRLYAIEKAFSVPILKTEEEYEKPEDR